MLIRDVGLASEQPTILATGLAPLLQGESANGLDDNANGLDDERGLSFERTAAGRVVIRLTLFSHTTSGPLTYSAEASVFPRN